MGASRILMPKLAQVVLFDRASDLLVLKAPGSAAGESELRLVALSAVKARAPLTAGLTARR